jgi:hypothetical protein
MGKPKSKQRAVGILLALGGIIVLLATWNFDVAEEETYRLRAEKQLSDEDTAGRAAETKAAHAGL